MFHLYVSFLRFTSSCMSRERSEATLKIEEGRPARRAHSTPKEPGDSPASILYRNVTVLMPSIPVYSVKLIRRF